MKKLIPLVFVSTLAVAATPAQTVDVMFKWPEPVGCFEEVGQVCPPVLGYRIYVEGGDLLIDTANSATVLVEATFDVGVEKCFQIAAYTVNGEGEKSDHAQAACKTVEYSDGKPAKTTLTVSFEVK